MPVNTHAASRIEYSLKGAFVGLICAMVFASTSWWQPLAVFGWTWLVTGIAILGPRPGQKGAKPRGPLLAVLVNALLDETTTVYIAVLLALLLGGVFFGWGMVLAAGVAIGAIAGILPTLLLGLSPPRRRIAVAVMLLAAIAIAGWAYQRGWYIESSAARWTAAFTILGSLPLFYLLLFAGRGEETEWEIGLSCLGLALALGMFPLPVMIRGIVVLLPVALFVVYCEKLRKQLIVFKHVLRGMGHEQQRQWSAALFHYRQALRLDAKSELASTGNWRIHRQINPADLNGDPQIAEWIDPLLCLKRAQSLIDSSSATNRRDEVAQLLELVDLRRHDLPQTTGHERLRLLLAIGDGPAALEQARRLVTLPPALILDLADHEADALFRTWRLLLSDATLIANQSPRILDEPDGLVSFLATLRRRAHQAPNDPELAAFVPFAYDKLTWDAYRQEDPERGPAPVDWLDYETCWRRGVAAVNDAIAGDAAAQARAENLLRIAEEGLPARRLEIWHDRARLIEKRDPDAAAQYYRKVKGAGREAGGPASLTEPAAERYFHALRTLAEQAQQRGDAEQAIENYQLYCESPRSGLETLRTLYALYRQCGDLPGAVRPIESALLYQLDERQRRYWLDEKLSLYGEIPVAEVRDRLPTLRRFFDFEYCLRQAQRRIDNKETGPAVYHFLELAQLGGGPGALGAAYLLGRLYFRDGKLDAAIRSLETVREKRPEKFASDLHRDHYFSACRLLGDIYLDHAGTPEKAVECYEIYKDYVKSGAETLYRLARAYEACGRPEHAKKWYNMVLVYPSHPKADLARQALQRLKVEVE